LLSVKCYLLIFFLSLHHHSIQTMALTRNTYQRNSSWNAPYTFSGKEKDAETGYGYFGARYYDSGLSIWLSVDPMSDKYPSMSPYNYCANNPVILVDPDGREIEYNSFIDFILVGITRIINPEFNRKVKCLKKSTETYVFNYNDYGDSRLSTDGEKVFINYGVTEEHKKESDNIISLLEHETEHAIQFEFGEVGFRRDETGTIDRDGNYFPQYKWVASNYDLNDERLAVDAAWKSGPNPPIRQWWKSQNMTQKNNILKNGGYPKLGHDLLVNAHSRKIKTIIRIKCLIV